MKHILDGLLGAQAQRLNEPKLEECYSCGRYKPMDISNLREWPDAGVDRHAMVCNDCIRQGWETWKQI
jgi:nitrate/TMAO reductase-like tetraheme cytochrome c subunit